MRPLLRSLLQKAIRRSRVDVATNVAYTLGSCGDSTWLNSRIGVIVFEECWQRASILHRSEPTLATLREVSHSIKNKDAAGLGSMAHALFEGDLSTLDYAVDSTALKLVAAGLKRPESFFDWALNQCSNEDQLSTVFAAKHYFSRASWPWDKAFMIAGAYLSLNSKMPLEASAKFCTEPSFPYWIAVDKHTPQGKTALRKVASTIGVPEVQLQWTSFYLESAKTNNLMPSPWWICETEWRLSGIGLTQKGAADIWNFASPLVQAAVDDSAKLLRSMVERNDNYSLC